MNVVIFEVTPTSYN